MDKIDEQIIKILADNARTPFSKIAKKIGISTQTVARRYDEMRQEGLIQHCSISIDVNKLGYEGTAYLLITCVSGSNVPEVMTKVKKIQNIIVATVGLGDYEGFAMLIFKDIKDCLQRISEIKNVPEIERIDICLGNKTARSFPPNFFKIYVEELVDPTTK